MQSETLEFTRANAIPTTESYSSNFKLSVTEKNRSRKA